jgi:hypothetical protein
MRDARKLPKEGDVTIGRPTLGWPRQVGPRSAHRSRGNSQPRHGQRGMGKKAAPIGELWSACNRPIFHAGGGKSLPLSGSKR